MMNLLAKTFFLFFLSLCFFSCNSLFYYPDEWQRSNPSSYGLKYEPLVIETDDREFLASWWVPALGPGKGVVVHFHGNAENMTSHYLYSLWLVEYGYHLVVFDYRGYGTSTGKPSRKGLVNDGKAVFKAVQNHPVLGKLDLFVLAQSLGGAVAIPALAKNPPPRLKAIILESTFSSYRKITRNKLSRFWISWPLQWPLSFLVSDDLSPIDSINLIHVPILFIHGTDDKVIPLTDGKNLFEAFQSGPKEFWEIPFGGHTSAFKRSFGKYPMKLLEYLRKVPIPFPDQGLERG